MLHLEERRRHTKPDNERTKMIKTKDKKVYVSIDFGADTTKSAVAYRDVDGNFQYSLAFNGGRGIPSIAYYDDVNKTWLFDSAGINALTKASFRYIVKIKDLLDLFAEDADLYDNQRKYKNFYYPPKERETYRSTIDGGRYFEANLTPRQVCRAFAQYCVDLLKAEIAAQFGKVDVVYVVVYPAFAQLDYIKELRTFVKDAAGCEDDNVLVFSAPKSVGVSAKEFGILDDKAKNVLIFNAGENEISVVKARFDSNNILTYGADGHCPPAPIGGRNVDLYLTNLLYERSTAIKPFGSTGDSLQGEDGSYYDQYCMQQEVKAGKAIFSDGRCYARAGSRVNFAVYREMLTDITLTKVEFADCCAAVYERVWQYVKQELEQPDNADGIDAIILSGGAADSYGLDKYIERKMHASPYKKVRYLDFSPENKEQGYDDILCDSKDTVPIGAALFGAGKYRFSIVTTRSYGTYNHKEAKGYYYNEFVEKGEIIPISGHLIEKECMSRPVRVTNFAYKDGEWYIDNEYYKCNPKTNDLKTCKVYFGDYDPRSQTSQKKSSFQGEQTDKNQNTTRLRLSVIGRYRLVFTLPKGFNYARYDISTLEDLLKENESSCLGMSEGFRIDSEGRAEPVVRCGKMVKIGKDRSEFRDIAPYNKVQGILIPKGKKSGMNIND